MRCAKDDGSYQDGGILPYDFLVIFQEDPTEPQLLHKGIRKDE